MQGREGHPQGHKTRIVGMRNCSRKPSVRSPTGLQGSHGAEGDGSCRKKPAVIEAAGAVLLGVPAVLDPSARARRATDAVECELSVRGAVVESFFVPFSLRHLQWL